mgnify:CR=1 FL=1
MNECVFCVCVFNMCDSALRDYACGVCESDSIGRTAVMYAAISGRVSVLAHLLHSVRAPHDHMCRYGRTGLHFSAASGDTAAVALLIQMYLDCAEKETRNAFEGAGTISHTFTLTH